MQRKESGRKKSLKASSAKLFLLLTLLALTAAFATFTFSANVDTNKPFHPLQQISKSTTNLQTADDNTNQIIDEADYATTAGNADTLDGYHAQDIIQSQKQKLECIKVSKLSAGSTSVNCPSTYVATGGGVDVIPTNEDSIVYVSAPVHASNIETLPVGWSCAVRYDSPVIYSAIMCYAICCRAST